MTAQNTMPPGVTSGEHIVLIVDDNPVNLGVIADYLEDRGLRILISRSGESALEKMQHIQPDIILLDVMMPGMDGFETCRRLQANEATRQIPVIFMTALTSTEDKVKGFEVGAVDYVTKPLTQEEVFARVMTHLRLQQQKRELMRAHGEIQKLNTQLHTENLRMSAELDVARQVQQMLLPKPQELEDLLDVDIAGDMQPADEVGGDYYDVFRYHDHIRIGIGDVTGHGLESSVFMVMTQAVVRALELSGETDPVRYLNILNRVLYDNARRMGSDKNLTLALLSYHAGEVRISGQHEQVIVVRQTGAIELIDTVNLGFWIGLEADIASWVAETRLTIEPGDGLVLYSDGITEAENAACEQYGLSRLCQTVQQHWHQSADAIRAAVFEDVLGYIGTHTMYDDITIVVVKRRMVT